MIQQEKFDNAANAILNMFSERLRDNSGNRLTPELANGLLSVLGSGLKEAFEYLKTQEQVEVSQVDSADENQ